MSSYIHVTKYLKNKLKKEILDLVHGPQVSIYGPLILLFGAHSEGRNHGGIVQLGKDVHFMFYRI